jgi:hydroxymethylglutaryl-CoA synthase
MTPPDEYGISGLSLYVPPYRVNLDDWCAWTGNDRDKTRAVVGASFRLRGPHESVYTLAAEAALKLILDYDVDPQRVGLLILATESSTDNAVGAVIVRGLLDEALTAHGRPPLARDCEVPEYKQACLAGLYGIKGAARYLAHDGAERQALVICADIAEYQRGSTGEPTQGAGAVALLMERAPKLLALDLARGGSASSYRIADFRKPFLRYAGQTPGAHGRLTDFPVFNGKYSTACYLDEVVCAFDALFARNPGRRVDYLRELAAAFMHRPYHHMPIAAWGMVYLFALAADGGAAHQELAAYAEAAKIPLPALLAEMGSRPDLARQVVRGRGAPEEAYPLAALAMKAFRRTPKYAEFVEAKLRLGAQPMMHLGNLYSAALPAWLAAGLEEALAHNLPLEERKLLLVGYGSGDAAEALPARVVPGWRAAAARIGFTRSLEGAVDLSRAQYECLHEGRTPPDLPEPRSGGFAIVDTGQAHSGRFQDYGIEYYRYRVPPATPRARTAAPHTESALP